MFIGFSKLLVCGGYEAVEATCEVINLQSSTSICKNPPNLPATIYSAIGGLGLKEKPIICGGRQNGVRSDWCYSLENNQWISTGRLNSVRSGAAAVQLQDGKILLTGGNNASDAINSVEMLTEDGWDSQIPSLPVTVYNHCMVAVNSTTVMVIGGIQNNEFSEKTFYFTFGEESWYEGPELKYKRHRHCCGKIKRDKNSDEMVIIVAGGWDESSKLSAVEILDEGANEWQTGLDLSFGIDNCQMVEDQNGGVVLIGGDSKPNRNLNFLYKLPHGGQDAVLTKMEEKLKPGRFQSTAFLIPDNLADCTV